MSRAAPIIEAFNAGELAPSLDGRTSLAKYFAGCKRLENFLPKVQGPAVRRGGTRFVAAVKNEAQRTWLIRFEFNATQFFVLEFGNLYVRFYTNHGRLLTGTVTAWSNATAYTVGDLASRLGVNYYCILAHTNQQPPNATYWYPLTSDIYEIPSPYALADLTNADGSCALKVVQSGDVLYIANQYRTYAPRKLTRHNSTRWIFTEYAPSHGPFIEQNTSATTMQATAATGSVTVIASVATFAATDVGRLIRLEVADFSTRPWEPGISYSTNDLVRSDGKTYKALSTATSGTSPPIHERGTAYDGKTGVLWEYQNAGYGVLRITFFTTNVSVTATVLTDVNNGLNVLPAEVVSNGTTRWNFGAWSATTEYPKAVTFFRNRLWWFGQLRLWGSVPDDFENMAADFFNEVTADNSVVRILAAHDVNSIEWAIGADRLVIGTGGGEFVAGEITDAEPLGPGNFGIKPQSRRRARSVEPLAIGSVIAYVQRAGKKLLSLAYSFESDLYVSTDLAVLAERIARSGIIGTAYQSEPSPILWAFLADGGLRGFTYDQEQDVTGWHRHPIGGTNVAVESVVCGPSPDGSREELWLIVKRTINGTTHRYVEFMERPWEGADDDGTPGDAQEDAFYVDSGLTYDGVPADTISGLDHLEGESVDILADGEVHKNRTVSGGTIQLNRECSVVQVGLQFTSRLVPMRIDAGGNFGTAQGKIKRIHAIVIRFLDSLGGKVGKYGGTLDPISTRQPSTPMGQADPIYRAYDHRMAYPSGYDRDGLIEIVQDQPLPMTVAAIMPELESQ